MTFYDDFIALIVLLPASSAFSSATSTFFSSVVVVGVTVVGVVVVGDEVEDDDFTGGTTSPISVPFSPPSTELCLDGLLGWPFLAWGAAPFLVGEALFLPPLDSFLEKNSKIN